MAPTFYRNLKEVQNILPGALWQLQNNKIVLVDDDQFVALSTKHLPLFQIVPQPQMP